MKSPLCTHFVRRLRDDAGAQRGVSCRAAGGFDRRPERARPNRRLRNPKRQSAFHRAKCRLLARLRGLRRLAHRRRFAPPRRALERRRRPRQRSLRRIIPGFSCRRAFPNASTSSTTAATARPRDIRVSGTPGPFITIVNTLNQFAFGPEDLQFYVDYMLEPDARYVKITSTVAVAIEFTAAVFADDYARRQRPFPCLSAPSRSWARPTKSSFRARPASICASRLPEQTLANPHPLPALPGLVADFIATKNDGVSYGLFADADADNDFAWRNRAIYGADATPGSVEIPFFFSSFLGYYYSWAPDQIAQGSDFHLHAIFRRRPRRRRRHPRHLQSAARYPNRHLLRSALRRRHEPSARQHLDCRLRLRRPTVQPAHDHGRRRLQRHASARRLHLPSRRRHASHRAAGAVAHRCRKNVGHEYLRAAHGYAQRPGDRRTRQAASVGSHPRGHLSRRRPQTDPRKFLFNLARGDHRRQLDLDRRRRSSRRGAESGHASLRRNAALHEQRRRRQRQVRPGTRIRLSGWSRAGRNTEAFSKATCTLTAGQTTTLAVTLQKGRSANRRRATSSG